MGGNHPANGPDALRHFEARSEDLHQARAGTGDQPGCRAIELRRLLAEVMQIDGSLGKWVRSPPRLPRITGVIDGFAAVCDRRSCRSLHDAHRISVRPVVGTLLMDLLLNAIARNEAKTSPSPFISVPLEDRHLSASEWQEMLAVVKSSGYGFSSIECQPYRVPYDETDRYSAELILGLQRSG